MNTENTLEEILREIESWKPGPWLLPEKNWCVVLSEAYREMVDCYKHESDIADALNDEVMRWVVSAGKRLGENVMLEHKIKRALKAIPCARVNQCGMLDYPYAPCCNLRMAFYGGEAFPADYLKEDGIIHLFKPPAGDEPRKSDGCFKLIGFDE